MMAGACNKMLYIEKDFFPMKDRIFNRKHPVLDITDAQSRLFHIMPPLLIYLSSSHSSSICERASSINLSSSPERKQVEGLLCEISPSFRWANKYAGSLMYNLPASQEGQ
ncbi:hypothetical protein ABD76_00945 [Paenibacillus dendritiformis]|nr:hypothetical protein [Paenibacillus dendritiformis]